MTDWQRRALVAVLALAGAFLVYRATRKEHGALERNRIFAERVVSGEDPYSTPVHAPYPPSYGLVMSPLLLLPLFGARIAWALLQLLMLAVLWRICLRWWQEALGPRGPPLWVPALALLLAARYVLRDMAGGGGNLVFGTLVLLACLRPGEPPGSDRRPLTGIGLGLVLAAKPTPVLFLPFRSLDGAVELCLGVSDFEVLKEYRRKLEES